MTRTLPATDPSRCPLCSELNACALAKPEAERTNECWCAAKRFPEALLARAPAGACICASCLERERAEPAE